MARPLGRWPHARPGRGRTLHTWPIYTQLYGWRGLYSAALPSPSLPAWSSNLRWLTQQAPLSPQATFTRYWQPFIPPESVHGSFLSHSVQALINAIARHDITAALALMRRMSSIPYPLWISLWSLIAEGPSSIPSHNLYDRLDQVCVQLCELVELHDAHFPTKSIRPMMRQRFLYLLLKRAERIDKKFGEKERHAVYDAQVPWLVRAGNDATAVDGDLLGRLIFRLAHMRAFSCIPTLLNAYVQSESRSADAVAAGQPFAAVLLETLAWHSSASNSSDADKALAFGIESVRLAWYLRLPIKYALVQELLRRIDPVELQASFGEENQPTTAILSQCFASCEVTPHIPTFLSRLYTTNPEYYTERVAVALCRSSDPRLALELIHTHQPIPYDVYAAAITALTWIVRARYYPDVAMHLALHTLDVLCEAGMQPDEQMFGELVRALQSGLDERIPSASLPCNSGDLGTSLMRSVRTMKKETWVGLLHRLGNAVLVRSEESVIRLDHLILLLRLAVRQHQYALSRDLYVLARQLHPEVFPCTSSSIFGWLFSHAYTRSKELSFALRLYQEYVAFGQVLSEEHVEPFLSSLLRHRMATMFQRVVGDLVDSSSLPRETVAQYVTRALLQQGYLDSALALARHLLTHESSHVPRDESLPPPLPPLSMYAICLYEASQTGHFGSDRASRKRLYTLFEEFRLALAHTFANGDSTSSHWVEHAYYGITRLYMQALGLDASAPYCVSNSLENAEKQKVWDELSMLWQEWANVCDGKQGSIPDLFMQEKMTLQQCYEYAKKKCSTPISHTY